MQTESNPAADASEPSLGLPDPHHIHTYTMVERSDRLDFEIRNESVRLPLIKPHRHEYFQIFANLEGQAPHLLSGRRCESTARSLIFVLPYRVHVALPGPGLRYELINFASNLLRPDFGLTPLEMEEASIAHYPELTPFIYQGWVDFIFTEAEFAHIESLLKRMRELNARRTLGTLERIRGALLELIGFTGEKFAVQIQSLAEQRVYLQTHTDALRRVLKFIDENLQTDISLNEVAEAAFLSPNYLSQLLKKQTGMAFVDWLTGRRMARAQELLAHTGDHVYTVANTVGYVDEAYFTRRFKQRFGVTPTDYRRSMNNAG
jgi:AraC-like DNA-binding protein